MIIKNPLTIIKKESGGTNKLPQVVDRTIDIITAEDLKGATKIGNYAFFGCSNLKSIKIPEGVTSIGYNAFEECNKLTAITIPNSVTSIGDSTFQNCSGLTSITIPDSVISIGYRAFAHCDKINTVNFNAKNCSIDNSFAYIQNKNGYVVNIGNQVQKIPDDAFGSLYRKVYVKEVNFEKNSVCSVIKHNAFAYAELLTKIQLPDSIRTIEYSAFTKCVSLTNITIPAGTLDIARTVFYDCSSLTQMTILATTPPTLENTNAISTATTTIYIPKGTLSAYQTATNWSNFADKFVELSE